MNLVSLAVMRTLTKEYVFRQVYDMAALVESCVEDTGSFIELGWNDNADLPRSLCTFSKTTILHRYIFAMQSVERRRHYRKNSDSYSDEPELVEGIERLLRAYNVDFVPLAQLMRAESVFARREDLFEDWIEAHDDQFDELWEKMTDEVFHLLFGNRAFLLKFNRALVEYLHDMEIKPPPEYLNEAGNIKRAFMPKWVRDAVFFRDHGRCVFCLADLSGLLNLDQSDHFDHIVPLAAGGINDPTNVQLLCEPCNLRKSAFEPKTGLQYPAWWPE